MASLGIIKGVTESILGVGEVLVRYFHQQSYLIFVVFVTAQQSALFKAYSTPIQY